METYKKYEITQTEMEQKKAQNQGTCCFTRTEEEI